MDRYESPVLIATYSVEQLQEEAAAVACASGSPAGGSIEVG
jgi:hypothetical protein